MQRCVGCVQWIDVLASSPHRCFHDGFDRGCFEFDGIAPKELPFFASRAWNKSDTVEKRSENKKSG